MAQTEVFSFRETYVNSYWVLDLIVSKHIKKHFILQKADTNLFHFQNARMLTEQTESNDTP